MKRVVLYDYETEKVRRKVRNNMKKLGIHAQWSVFESEAEFQRILRYILEEERNFRVAVFRINPRGEILKLGREWEKLRFVF